MRIEPADAYVVGDETREPELVWDAACPGAAVLHLAVRNVAEARHVRLCVPGHSVIVHELAADRGRRDYYWPVPSGISLSMVLSGLTPITVIEGRLLASQGELVVAGASAQAVTEANWKEVQRQEREHPEFCRALPELVQLEITKMCNFRCAHCCTHGTDEVHAVHNRAPHMSEETLDRIADELFPFLRRVDLVGAGEPFCAPSTLLGRLVDHLARTDTRFEATTNGSLLTPALIDRILPVLSQITFSVDAASSDTYRRVRGQDRFETVLAAIRRMVELRDSLPLNRRFNISMVFTMMMKNHAELVDFIRLAADLGVDTVYARHLLVHHPAFRNETLIERADLANPVIEAASAEAVRRGVTVFLPDLIDPAPQVGETPVAAGDIAPSRVPCMFLWRSAVICSDGEVISCGGLCPVRFGQVGLQAFSDIWNGPEIREMRRRLDTRDPHPACRHCWYREIAYFDSPAISDNFTSQGNRRPGKKGYDVQAFHSRK